MSDRDKKDACSKKGDTPEKRLRSAKRPSSAKRPRLESDAPIPSTPQEAPSCSGLQVEEPVPIPSTSQEAPSHSGLQVEEPVPIPSTSQEASSYSGLQVEDPVPIPSTSQEAPSRSGLQVEEPVPIPSTSQEAPSCSGLQVKVEVEQMAQSSSNPSEGSSSEYTTSEESQSAPSVTSGESSDDEREIINIIRIEDSPLCVTYFYELLKTEKHPSKQKKKKKDMPYFRLPIFNDETLKIYKRYIKCNQKFHKEIHPHRNIQLELTRYSSDENITLPMFKEVAKTCTNPPTVIEESEERKIRVCGTVDDAPNHAFVHFDTKTSLLIQYLLRLLTKSNIPKIPVERDQIMPEVLYAKLNPNFTANRRVLLCEGSMRIEEDKVKMLQVDTGMEDSVHISNLYKLTELCEELRDIPHQATRVVVRSFDGDTSSNYITDEIEKCHRDARYVKAKRSEEQVEGPYPSLDLQSIRRDDETEAKMRSLEYECERLQRELEGLLTLV